MKNIIKISTPLDIKKIVNLRAGDFVNITGNIYAARDAAHKRFFELIEKGKKLPIDLKGQILERGLKGMIGKGLRSKEVMESIKKNKAIYFAAIGGAAALIAKSIKKSEVIAYRDLGAEAVFRFYVEDFPAIVVIDSAGNNLYETEPLKYRK